MAPTSSQLAQAGRRAIAPNGCVRQLVCVLGDGASVSCTGPHAQPRAWRSLQLFQILLWALIEQRSAVLRRERGSLRRHGMRFGAGSRSRSDAMRAALAFELSRSNRDLNVVENGDKSSGSEAPMPSSRPREKAIGAQMVKSEGLVRLNGN